MLHRFFYAFELFALVWLFGSSLSALSFGLSSLAFPLILFIKYHHTFSLKSQFFFRVGNFSNFFRCLFCIFCIVA